MSKERFKENTNDSFYGRFLYEQVVPKDHFLLKLNELIREKRIDSAIHLNNYRTQKKDKNKEIWVKLCVRHPEDASASEGKESPSYQRGIEERKRIEGKFSSQDPVGRGDEEASWL